MFSGLRSFVVLGLIVAVGCTSTTPAPVIGMPSSAPKAAPTPRVSAPPTAQLPLSHTVVRGDTLYSISWRYGLDYRDVARLNQIQPPYTIYVGQVIRFQASGQAPTPMPAPAPTTSTSSAAPQSPSTPAPPPPTAAREPSSVIQSTSSTATTANLVWRWPTQGRVISTFSETAPGKKGISIAGQRGQNVVAAADGRVVYSGAGLQRYGNLLIIKHNDVYLSAYAHNETLMVQEGQDVKGGQVIAKLGNTGTQQDQLHFEIRRNGKPVDPLRFLPKQ